MNIRKYSSGFIQVSVAFIISGIFSYYCLISLNSLENKDLINHRISDYSLSEEELDNCGLLAIKDISSGLLGNNSHTDKHHTCYYSIFSEQDLSGYSVDLNIKTLFFEKYRNYKVIWNGNKYLYE